MPNCIPFKKHQGYYVQATHTTIIFPVLLATNVVIFLRIYIFFKHLLYVHSYIKLIKTTNSMKSFATHKLLPNYLSFQFHRLKSSIGRNQGNFQQRPFQNSLQFLVLARRLGIVSCSKVPRLVRWLYSWLASKYQCKERQWLLYPGQMRLNHFQQLQLLHRMSQISENKPMFEYIYDEIVKAGIHLTETKTLNERRTRKVT